MSSARIRSSWFRNLWVSLCILLFATCAIGQRVIDVGRGIPSGQQVSPPPLPTGPLLPGVGLDDCVLHSSTPFDMRWNLVASSSLRGLWEATPDTPHELDFDFSGILRLELTRPSKNYGGGALVVIRQRRQNEGTFSELCRVSVPMLNATSRAEITKRISETEAVRVQVEVFDLGGGGPTTDPPYTIGLRAFTSNPLPPSTQQRAMESESSIRECKIVDRPTRDQASLEPVQSVNFDGQHKHWRYLDYIEAGRSIYVRLSRGNKSNSRTGFEVLAFAKNAGRDAFKPVCRVILDGSYDEQGFILAARPDSDEYLFDPIWRLEVRPKKMIGDNLEETAVMIEVYRERDPENNYSRPASTEAVTSVGSMAFLCVPPTSRFAPRITSQGFPTTQAVEVDVVVDPSLKLPKTMKTLESYIVQAAGLWRESCQQCQIDSLLLLKVNGKLYWRDRAVRIVLADGPKPADLAGVFSVRGNTASFLTPESTKAVRHEVCGVPYSQSTPRLQSLQRSLGCRGAPVGANSAKVTLKIQSKPTSCGDNANIVACESNGRLIELNARDYTFREFGFGNQIAKGGPRSIDLFHVILHEMGHWIGLDHEETPGSLMSPQYSTSRCIDGETAAKIGNAPSDRTVVGRTFLYEREPESER